MSSIVLCGVINRDGQKDYRRQTQFCFATYTYDLSRPFYEKKCRLFMLFLFLLLPQTNGIIGDEKFRRMLIDEEMHSSSEDGWNAFEQHHDMSWITIC
ncbi:hypothetical protein T07_8029 [Trichinella nelsoni]|uniref:Uncharacterized protein n=1 Tax=Trichinella nelsoni TaxID=6336 RepID=A0A0V0SNA3_9BILA|nr:hypothetical protein T07_8029 [Trichinella nelsoni]